MSRKLRLDFPIGLLSLCCLLAAVNGCGPEEPTAADLQSELSTNFGEVVLSYNQPLDVRDIESDHLSLGLSLSARFVQYTDIARQEQRFLWDENLPFIDVSLNGCQAPEARSQQDQVLTGSLELLDAGELTLQVANEEQRVPDWNFPSVYGVVAGVIYGGEEPLDLGFHPGQEYRLSSSGTEQIGNFELSINAPAELTGVVVGGVDVSDLGDEALTIDAPGPLDIRWEPEEEPGEVLVELSFAQFSTENRQVCRSLDDGHLEIPRDISNRLWEAGVSDARLVLYRIHRQSFQAEGLGEAEALFIVTLIVPLQLP